MLSIVHIVIVNHIRDGLPPYARFQTVSQGAGTIVGKSPRVPTAALDGMCLTKSNGILLFQATLNQIASRDQVISTMTVDVLIIVALTEEADELTSSNFYQLSREERLENFTFQTFHFRDSAGNKRSGTIVCTGEVGQRARDAETLFCSNTPPRLVLNVGISGRVKDALVGDVVVPTYVNAPGHRASIEDNDAGGYQEAPGGKPFDVSSRALALVKSKSFRAGLGLPTLLEFARNQKIQISDEDLSKIKNWIETKVVSNKPTIVDGPFSAGQAVVKSTNYKIEVLGKTDRNIIALDMGSAFIAASLANFDVQPDFFAVRAISDPADSRKAEFDAIGNGIFRRWAISNMRAAVRHLLEKTDIFRDVSNDISKSILDEHPTDDYLPNYPGQRLLDLPTLTAYDDRFSNIRVGSDKEKSFSSLLNQIDTIRAGSRILVQGRGGTGKSALLKKLQIELDRIGEVETIFINVRKLLEISDSDNIESYIDEKMINIDLYENKRMYVFLDELYGEDREQKVLSLVSERLSSRDPIVCLAFGQDHFDVISINTDSETSAHIYDSQYDLIIDAKAVSISNQFVATNVIRGLIQTSYKSTDADPSVILDQLIEMGFTYINHFVVSMYLDNYKKK